MKSLKDYSLNITEKQYHALPAWSYSLIARYAREGFSSIASLHEPVEETSSMRFGSLFDSFLTKGKQTLNDYFVTDVSVPDAERKALEYISDRTDKPHAKINELSQDDLMAYCDECKYQPRWGYKARVDHLSAYEDYYDALRTGRHIVSSTDWNDALSMFNIFRKDPYLKELFGTKNTKDVEYLYQLKFQINFKTEAGTDVLLKIMPDLIKVDHKAKTVQPVDLKTSSLPGYQFKENFLKFRYDIQAQLYSDVLEMILKKAEGYEDYTILPYLFTVISRTDKVPVTFIYDQTDISQLCGLSYSTEDREYHYRHWSDLLQEIINYEKMKAVVPGDITLDGPNDLLSILASNRRNWQ